MEALSLTDWRVIGECRPTQDDLAFVQGYLGHTRLIQVPKGISDYTICRLRTTLTWLNLSNCKGVQLNVRLPCSLTHLWVRNINLDIQLFSLFPRSLELLDMSDTMVQDFSYHRLPNLHTLWLERTQVTGVGFSELPPKLTKLSLRGCEELVTLDNLPVTLTWLDVRECRWPLYLPDREFEILLTDATKMSDELSLLVEIADQGPAFEKRFFPDAKWGKLSPWILEHLPDQMEVLNVTGCKLLQQTGYLTWPNGLRELEVPFPFFDQGIERLPRGLQKLSIGECKWVTEFGWRKLPPILREFKITSPTVDPSLFKHLPKGLQRLELDVQTEIAADQLSNLPAALSLALL